MALLTRLPSPTSKFVMPVGVLITVSEVSVLFVSVCVPVGCHV